MNEANARTLLNRVADTDGPPSGIDLSGAISAGRRLRRRRRLSACVSAMLAAGAAVAIVVALVAVPGRPQARPQPTVGTGPVAPARFNPLVPYASFGWLPSGYRVGGPDSFLFSATQALTLDVRQSSVTIYVTVEAGGVCRATGSASRPVLVCGSKDDRGSLTAVSRAPDVSGHSAFRDKAGTLFWEYAPGGWTIAGFNGPQGKLPPDADLLRIAATIRYGQATAIRFPYWVSGPAASWQVNWVQYTEPAGVPLASSLSLIPAGGRYSYLLGAKPGPDPGCSVGPLSPRVTVDGVAAGLTKVLLGRQELCIPHIHGDSAYVIVHSLVQGNNQLPAAASPDGVIGIAERMRFLGLDPAGWTTNPLR
jgi:hypothetical protein